MRMYEFNLWEKQTLKEKIVKNLLFTWAPLTGYKYNNTLPIRIELSDEEKKMKRDLRRTFTPESVKEWGREEMISHIRDDIKPHPNAKGYREIK